MNTEPVPAETPDPSKFDNRMSDAEIQTLLRSADHGVLSLAEDNTAYSLPISYGVHPDTESLFFQFVIQAGSRKSTFVNSTETASFTVSQIQDDDWCSVVVGGPISTVEQERTSDVYAIIAESAWFPDFTVFDGPAAEAEFELFELSIETIDGRKAPTFEI